MRTRRRLAAVFGVCLLGGLILVAAASQESVACGQPVQTGPVANGQAVIAAGISRKVPEQGIVIGLTAALAESRMRNLANPNVPASLLFPNDGISVERTAVGILQQEQDWGSAAERMNPRIAADRFFAEMMAVPGWQSLPAGQAAQMVQRSAYPGRYAGAVAAEADQFYREHLGEVLAGQPCTAGHTQVAA
ncbi:hypothetical protein [Mycobacterium sp. DBP42]|uniref:hypothetical protein n=1 Tax=Mycobacteriaceae TaxID=1762 RepID=UPI00110CE12A|nr:hypothetical protein [Mycobacterium sp. DBP42]TMS50700.1 hypothetical protein E0T84_22705 [Mycobacterium sp. DBP42]